jgi:hypothetical protein
MTTNAQRIPAISKLVTAITYVLTVLGTLLAVSGLLALWGHEEALKDILVLSLIPVLVLLGILARIMFLDFKYS